jgi:hypothetical protein
MTEFFKAENIARAIRLLPAPKTYPATTVTVAVGKLKYNFDKHENQWILICQKNVLQ